MVTLKHSAGAGVLQASRRLKRLPIAPIFVCLGTISGLSRIASADEFNLKLIEGRGVQVCEAYAAARNAVDASGIEKCRLGQPLHERGISRQSLSGQLLNLTVPPTFEGSAERQEKLAEIHSALLHQKLIPFSAEFDTTLSGEAVDDVVMESLAVYTLPVVSIDVDNDGNPESVFFYLREISSWSPTINGAPFGAPIILGSGGTSVDRQRTLEIFRLPVAHALHARESATSELAQLALADFLNSSQFSFFRFHGKTYFDVTFEPEKYADERFADDPEAMQRVFLSEGGGTRELCTARCARQAPVR